MLTLLLSSLGVLLVGLVASVHPSRPTSFQVIEQLTSVPDGWTQGPAPDKTALLRFNLAVHAEKEAIFHQRVVNISTPGHPLYGSHMKRDEAKDFLRPRSEVSAQLLFWLTSGGLSCDKIKVDGAWISFDATYSVPVFVAFHVRMIQPTTRFARLPLQGSTLFRVTAPSIERETEKGEVNRNEQITPSYLRTLYKIPYSKEPQYASSKVGVSEYLERYTHYTDLQLFLSAYVPEAPEANFSVKSINGGLNVQDSSAGSMEANLAIQPSTELQRTISGAATLLLNLADEDLSDVLTPSYGENEQSVPTRYAEVACSLFEELGARGVSGILSSSDSGVGSSCKSNDGTNRIAFTPIFPGACPFVTSVGATEGINPEIAVAFSSGGFSERFDRPSYQEKAVQAYLNRLGNRWDGLYNPAGRDYPGVAAQGVSYPVFDNGELIIVDGTSASTPTVAAVISHLNVLRLSQHNPVLSFLNPGFIALASKGSRISWTEVPPAAPARK
ncbi:hypothetical protein ACJ73_02176 [Blastomyces percursus]|uniref:tripeptidyl-peptidase II n=1 Tax=Blastomyces percursus TaxID=1658174 RepID=A0A1J9RFL9_9EURO|nr:hypothetical protein ACJ73_02176 [Blastomyces percursus]